jgi:hypothetical protein
MNVILAELITKAANTREGSWVHSNNEIHGFYSIDLQDACISACVDHPALAEPVRLLLQDSWNQALDWAANQK